jgi:hypothetical protein
MSWKNGDKLWLIYFIYGGIEVVPCRYIRLMVPAEGEPGSYEERLALHEVVIRTDSPGRVIIQTIGDLIHQCWHDAENHRRTLSPHPVYEDQS